MNFGTPVPLLVGLILILGAVGLFFLDKLKPGYERSSDKVYSILLLISGVFLLAHLNMELLASFQQVMLVGMLTTLIINDITKREPNRNVRPAERDAPPRRYDERPRRVYRAELDDWNTPGPVPPRIPSNRVGQRDDGYGDRYEPRPLEPRPPYEDRRPPARLQPGGRPDERFDNYAGSAPGRPDGRPDSRPDGRPDSRPDGRPDSRPDSRFGGPPNLSGPPNGAYDGPPRGSGSPPPSRPRPPHRPLDAPVPAGNGAGHSLGGVPQPPRDASGPRPERPPLNVRPRPADSTESSYTDFRPAPTASGDSDSYPESPPPQPPANY